MPLGLGEEDEEMESKLEDGVRYERRRARKAGGFKRERGCYVVASDEKGFVSNPSSDSPLL